jgi:hypothetical protein
VLVKVNMAHAAECIEFTIDELQVLQQTNNLAFVLKICFLYGSDEAFHALCAIVEYGKDMCATSKRVKRDARVDLYKKFLLVHYPYAHDPAHHYLTYYEFATSLSTFSERWSTQFPFDELLSLAFIVDRGEYGVINLDVFMAFMEDVDTAFHSNPSYPNVALDGYYDGRRETLFKHVMVAFQSVELRNKLAYLASLACQFHVQPLTVLFDMLDSDSEATNEHVVGFIVQLTGTVNQGIKQLEAANVLVEEGHALPPFSPISTPNGSVKGGGKISPMGSVASSVGNGNERLSGESASTPAKQPPLGQQSCASKLFAPIEDPPEPLVVETSPAEVRAVRGSEASSLPASVEPAVSSSRHSSPSPHASVSFTGSSPRARSESEVVPVPLASAAAIIEAVQVHSYVRGMSSPT